MEGGGGGGEEEDHLSSLPDAILLQILSLLPTRLALQSSILSRRFRHLWHSLPDLSFDDRDFPSHPNNPEDLDRDDDALPNLVEAVLLLRDRSLPLRRFRFHSSSFVPLPRLSTWIRAAAAGGSLRFLDVAVPAGFDVPSPVFSCRSLHELELRVKYWDVRATLAAPVSLDNLRILRLHDADLLNDGNERALGDLISACPVLAELCLDGCYFGSLRIEAYALQRLRFHHYDYNDVVVALRTPGLRFLDHMCEGMERFSLGEMPSLEKALFDFGGYTKACDEELVIDALRGLSSATALTLYDFMVVFPPRDRLVTGSLPAFHNLRDLSLIYPIKRDESFLSVSCLLHSAPNLDTLRIEEAAMSPQFGKELISRLMNILPSDYVDRLDGIEIDQYVDSSECLCDRWKFSFING